MKMGWTKLLGDAFATLLRQEDRALRVIGRSPKDANVIIKVIVKERSLQNAMVDFAWRIFILSLLISLITAALVYFSLQCFMVRPMLRLTDNVVGFRENPEDASRAFHPSKRPDEIGVAERELMRRLSRKPRLARHPVLCAARLGPARRIRRASYRRACCVAGKHYAGKEQPNLKPQQFRLGRAGCGRLRRSAGSRSSRMTSRSTS